MIELSLENSEYASENPNNSMEKPQRNIKNNT